VESSSPIFAGLTPFLLWFVESCISLLCRLDAKWRLTEDANATDLSHHFRPSESVVHDFVNSAEISLTNLECPLGSDTSTESQTQPTRDNPVSKSRLLVYKNEDIFNPMKSRMQLQPHPSSSSRIESSSNSGAGTKAIGPFDIIRDCEVDDRESSSSRFSVSAGGNEEVHL
jgi:hypothetical protein